MNRFVKLDRSGIWHPGPTSIIIGDFFIPSGGQGPPFQVPRLQIHQYAPLRLTDFFHSIQMLVESYNEIAMPLPGYRQSLLLIDMKRCLSSYSS